MSQYAAHLRRSRRRKLKVSRRSRRYIVASSCDVDPARHPASFRRAEPVWTALAWRILMRRKPTEKRADWNRFAQRQVLPKVASEIGLWQGKGPYRGLVLQTLNKMAHTRVALKETEIVHTAKTLDHLATFSCHYHFVLQETNHTTVNLHRNGNYYGEITYPNVVHIMIYCMRLFRTRPVRCTCRKNRCDCSGATACRKGADQTALHLPGTIREGRPLCFHRGAKFSGSSRIPLIVLDWIELITRKDPYVV